MTQDNVLVLSKELADKLSRLASQNNQTINAYIANLISDGDVQRVVEKEPTAELTEDDIKQLVAGYDKWYHQYEFLPGVKTNAQQKTAEILNALDTVGLPQDASGLRVLDVGCCDGFFSFEMEKRGAEVVPIDYRNVNNLGFGIAKRILKSDLTARVDTIYNVTPQKYGQFDIVLFLGVLYHLRHPILALDRMRAMLSPGGKIFLETHMIPDGDENLPLSKYYRRDALGGNYTNYFGPNAACVEAWLDAAEFKLIDWQEPTRNRGVFGAEAVEDPVSARFRDLEFGSVTRLT
jgi:tRNA (mo5U34)-methyltransferase